MKAQLTFNYLLNSNTEAITISYDNPFIEMLQISDVQKKQVFNLCALSYITGRLEQEKLGFTNLQLFSIEDVV